MRNLTGKFIVLYGINNLGKTAQAKMLVNKLNSLGVKAEYLKYPIYSLPPSGEIINNYLRKGNIFGLSPREAQIFYALNRIQYQAELYKKLKNGITIIAEDYTATSLAWGGAAGVDEHFLKYINSHLIKEDLALLLDGERYLNARESCHQYENNHGFAIKSRQIHRRLAGEFKWRIINAGLPIKDIHQIILREVRKIIPGLSGQLSPNWEESRPAIKIERINPAARIPQKENCTTGISLYSADYYTLFPYEKNIIQTGLKINIPWGYMGLIIDHSDFIDQGILTINRTIGPEYKNELIVNILNLSFDLLHIYPGQKIAQLLIQKVESPEIRETGSNNKIEQNQNYFSGSGHF